MSAPTPIPAPLLPPDPRHGRTLTISPEVAAAVAALNAVAADHARTALATLAGAVAAHPEFLEAPQVLCALLNGTRATSGAPWPARCRFAAEDLRAALREGVAAGEPGLLSEAISAWEDAHGAALSAVSGPSRMGGDCR